MPKRSWLCAALLTAAILAAVPAMAQDKPATDKPAADKSVPDDQVMQDQIQQTFRQIIQNMFAKGIDPRQFFQQIQDGADPADIAKQLVDQGLIDQESLTQLQTNSQKMTSGRIRARLACSDDEWAVLEPMIRKVMTAQAVIQRAAGSMGGGGGGMRGGMMSGFMAVQTPTGTALSKAVRGLRAALQSKNASADEVAAALATFRDARDRANAELAAAQRDLTSAVTVRQEGVLATIGILE